MKIAFILFVLITRPAEASFVSWLTTPLERPPYCGRVTDEASARSCLRYMAEKTPSADAPAGAVLTGSRTSKELLVELLRLQGDARDMKKVYGADYLAVIIRQDTEISLRYFVVMKGKDVFPEPVGKPVLVSTLAPIVCDSKRPQLNASPAKFRAVKNLLLGQLPGASFAGPVKLRDLRCRQ